MIITLVKVANGQPLDYRCLNIDADVMVRAVKEVIDVAIYQIFENQLLSK